MKILVINSGSSSVKYQLVDMENRKAICSGSVTKIGSAEAVLEHKRASGDGLKQTFECWDHRTAIARTIDILMDKEYGVIKDKKEIDAVGHRVVHGGEKFSGSVYIDSEVINTLVECCALAPLHNPHNLKGIYACQEVLPGVPMCGTFDTAFHQTMEKAQYMYALPGVLYEKYRVRRYGFHGTSHLYVSGRAHELSGKPAEFKCITAHLGNGASIAAVKNGKSIDTSMGFTPLEGLVMGTRCGDIDPAIILHIMEVEGLSIKQASNILNKYSGLYGLSGGYNDMRDIQKRMGEGDENARLAFDVYCYRVRKYIGAYAAAMGGLDAIVFTAGVGENSPEVREACLKDLEFLGVKLDREKNTLARGKEVDITTPDSKVKVFVIPTNEELVIAIDTARIVEEMKRSGKLKQASFN